MPVVQEYLIIVIILINNTLLYLIIFEQLPPPPPPPQPHDFPVTFEILFPILDKRSERSTNGMFKREKKIFF